ncbi:MAG: NADH-quinone oxidoreductase subunit N [Acidobacteriota bacterium]|nr:NADH-quinone oxidoreductase subunit N [Acidobacteriota bacterium]
MSSADLIAILPLLILGGASVVVMVGIAIRRSHALTLAITLIGLAAAFASLFWVAPLAPRQVSSLLIIDKYALFYMGLVFAATFAVALLCHGYFGRQEGSPEELYILLLIAALGSAVLVASSHFISFFLGLELLSVALYALTAYLRTRRFPLEAGIKYLILAASSAAFLLFGMALVYSQIGTMDFGKIRELVLASPPSSHAILLAGTALIITGFGFKLALVPFHLWTPDIYEGAPAPITAFVATVSKGAMFALLLRYFSWSGSHHFGAVFLVFTIIAIASMIAGNLLAMMQDNVKRILAYSSIAHMGYVLVAFQAGGELAAQAVAFYLAAYFITIIGAFGVISVLSGGKRDADDIADYRGLFWKRPVLAAVFTGMLLSLAGIPLTAGFVAKFYVITAGTSSAIWLLVFVLIITSVFGLYYYLRVIVAMYSGLGHGEAAEAATSSVVPKLSLSGGVVLAVLTILLVWVGVYPATLFHIVHATVAGVL